MFFTITIVLSFFAELISSLHLSVHIPEYSTRTPTMQHSDARPQWGHYYPVVPNGFYPGPSVPQGYPTQNQNYHAGHGSVHGGSVVVSPSTDVTLYPLQAVRSLRDPFEGDHFPPTGEPVNFGSIRLEFLPRRYTGRSASDPIMFSVRGTLGVPLLEMQKGCPIDAGNDAAFPANWPDKTASWLLDVREFFLLSILILIRYSPFCL
ncbi:hypothetical protein GYMLUDRAFT_240962 [Collybiopsis luxurians FD-317 M1]|nr:hypothetical protein GYMLUDRAFT_240962 [Collybiopsis luxurians FD-317 M1]